VTLTATTLASCVECGRFVEGAHTCQPEPAKFDPAANQLGRVCLRILRRQSIEKRARAQKAQR
jgi:hypothetical protein